MSTGGGWPTRSCRHAGGRRRSGTRCARAAVRRGAATRLSELRNDSELRDDGGAAAETHPGDLRNRQHQRGPRGAAGQRRFLLRFDPEHVTLAPRNLRRRGGRRLGPDVRLRGSRRPAPEHPVRRLGDQRCGRLAADGFRDAAGLPDCCSTATNVRLVVWLPQPGTGSGKRGSGSMTRRWASTGNPTAGGRGGHYLLLLWYLSPHRRSGTVTRT